MTTINALNPNFMVPIVGGVGIGAQSPDGIFRNQLVVRD
jgi:hypothetical protein